MNIAKTIDHTLLKPEATAADIQALCREAKQYGFASVCVNTCYVRLASELLRGSGVKVCCTVGFPLGAMAPKAKAFEAAQAVADALGKRLIIWNVKTTTKAQDGLYVYDVVQRLYDSQFGGQGVDDIAKYIKLGKLGEAFSSDEQVVLLIDEIDKADLEFPNDLLWELDKMEFYIPETKETIKAKQRPIVVITSNAEKELPDAFLRRCVFHYIEFPDQAQMEAILRVHFDNLEEKLIKQSLAAFYRLRELRGIEKKPSTSELVDWIRALVAGDVDPKLIEDNMPFAGVLLKKDKDLQTLRKQKR